MTTFQQVADLVRANWDSRSGQVKVEPYGQGLRLTHVNTGKTFDISVVTAADLQRDSAAFNAALIAPALQQLRDSLSS